MIGKLFGKKNNEPDTRPSIMGLRIGCSFELDPLMLKLTTPELMISTVANQQIIEAAGMVIMDDTTIYRFYTDDEAFLQVVAQNGREAENVVDVKLYHFYDTLDVSNQADWDQLLSKKIGQPHYVLEDTTYQRVWTAVNDYHNPVHMCENTFDADGSQSKTDQFTMLFEREMSNGEFESLFLAAEEREDPPGSLNRSLVISTGMTVSSSQITIHG